MAIIGQLIGMALNTILQNAGDDNNNNGLINAIVSKVAKNIDKKKLDPSEEVEKVANQKKGLF